MFTLFCALNLVLHSASFQVPSPPLLPLESIQNAYAGQEILNIVQFTYYAIIILNTHNGGIRYVCIYK